MKNPRTRLFLIIAVFVVVCVVMVFLAVLSTISQSGSTTVTPKGEDTAEYDPDSGDTLIRSNNVRESEISDGVILMGFTFLDEIGLTNEQQSIASEEMVRYARIYEPADEKSVIISLVRSSLRQKSDRRTHTTTVSGEIKINENVSQKVEFMYAGLSDLIVRITDKDSGKQLYLSEFDDHLD